jgi:UDP-N-acetylglucosamine--N-acetylmuramyl-(pentapeptide) pyrophosphoryl-undecaprenol N-acetylglucosamine transferase
MRRFDAGEIQAGTHATAAPLIVFAGGGTAGHLYPALSVAAALRTIRPEARFVFFGTRRPIDAQVLEANGEELVPQDVRPLPMRPWKWPAFLSAWREARRHCRAHFRLHQPAVVAGTGGFASAPAVVEAARMGVPTALFNPDLVPGKANRMLASRATVVFVQWPESARYFGGKAALEALGCPVRADFSTATRAGGVQRFNLDPARRTLLVTGASLGAHSINSAMVCLAAFMAEHKDWQVLHLTGRSDCSAVEAAYRIANVKATVLEYTEHMAEAMAAADLIVSRAGASSLAEITALGKPSVLIPYPHHRDQHQLAQAELLEARGAARVCREEGSVAQTAGSLRAILAELFRQPDAIVRMAASASRCGTPNAAEKIARRLLAVMEGESVEEFGGRGASRMKESASARR